MTPTHVVSAEFPLSVPVEGGDLAAAVARLLALEDEARAARDEGFRREAERLSNAGKGIRLRKPGDDA